MRIESERGPELADLPHGYQVTQRTRMRWATHDRLVKVAAIYRNAIADGLNPTATVAERLHVSHSRAANLVHQARRIGKLDPTTRGVAHARIDRPA